MLRYVGRYNSASAIDKTTIDPVTVNVKRLFTDDRWKGYTADDFILVMPTEEFSSSKGRSGHMQGTTTEWFKLSNPELTYDPTTGDLKVKGFLATYHNSAGGGALVTSNMDIFLFPKSVRNSMASSGRYKDLGSFNSQNEINVGGINNFDIENLVYIPKDSSVDTGYKTYGSEAWSDSCGFQTTSPASLSGTTYKTAGLQTYHQINGTRYYDISYNLVYAEGIKNAYKGNYSGWQNI